MAAYETALRNVSFQVEATEFKDAFAAARPTLLNTEAAKLVFADQFGVGQVTDEIFQTLVAAPACDFLFFISSSTLHRFADHPAIKQKIKRPNDYYHVHNAVLAYYRQLLSDETDYYLAPFSIKKGANIYGIIFGSAHLRGIDKFLNVAWKEDQFSGAADFDIDRANIRRDELLLDLAPFKPTKVQAFENDLENEILAGRVSDEVDVMRICFEHGVKRQHAKHILAKLKTEGKMSADFQVPDVARLKDPRPIRLLPGDD